MFENRVLRRIFGPKGDGVIGERRRLHNEKLNDVVVFKLSLCFNCNMFLLG